MGKQELWICRHCHANKPALLTATGRVKVARFRTGFVGVQLVCRHWVAVKSGLRFRKEEGDVSI